MTARFASTAAFALLLTLGVGQHALACYTVYDRTNTIVYFAQTPPVDMTPPFKDRLQKSFPGSHMVFGNTTNCPAKQAGYNPVKPPPSSAPLFTDKQTAEDMKVTHTVLPNGAVMVAKPPGNMRPGFTVMNLGGRQGGAASASTIDQTSPAPVKSGSVITEMNNPPITVIQKDSAPVRERR
jgi:hypothetical protein